MKDQVDQSCTGQSHLDRICYKRDPLHSAALNHSLVSAGHSLLDEDRMTPASCAMFLRLIVSADTSFAWPRPQVAPPLGLIDRTCSSSTSARYRLSMHARHIYCVIKSDVGSLEAEPWSSTQRRQFTHQNCRRRSPALLLGTRPCHACHCQESFTSRVGTGERRR